MNILMKWTLVFAAFMLVMKPGHSHDITNQIKPAAMFQADDQARLDFCNE